MSLELAVDVRDRHGEVDDDPSGVDAVSSEAENVARPIATRGGHAPTPDYLKTLIWLVYLYREALTSATSAPSVVTEGVGLESLRGLCESVLGARVDRHRSPSSVAPGAARAVFCDLDYYSSGT